MRIKLITALLLFCVFVCAKAQERQEHPAIGVFIKASLPYLNIATDNSYKENFFQGMQGGVEYKPGKRIGIEVLYGYRKEEYQGITELSSKIKKSNTVVPSILLYIEPKCKLHLDFGTKFAWCYFEKNAEGETLSQHYWQNSWFYGFGYKVFLFKKKRFGIDIRIRRNFVLTGNAEAWTEAFFERSLDMGGLLFYKF